MIGIFAVMSSNEWDLQWLRHCKSHSLNTLIIDNGLDEKQKTTLQDLKINCVPLLNKIGFLDVDVFHTITQTPFEGMLFYCGNNLLIKNIEKFDRPDLCLSLTDEKTDSIVYHISAIDKRVKAKKIFGDKIWTISTDYGGLLCDGFNFAANYHAMNLFTGFYSHLVNDQIVEKVPNSKKIAMNLFANYFHQCIKVSLQALES